MSTNNQTTTEEEIMTIERDFWMDQLAALENLESNKDFQLVILNGYFKERALDLVSLLGNDYTKNSGKRPEVMEQMVAISTLQDHFATIKSMGAAAHEDLMDDTDVEAIEE